MLTEEGFSIGLLKKKKKTRTKECLSFFHVSEAFTLCFTQQGVHSMCVRFAIVFILSYSKNLTHKGLQSGTKSVQTLCTQRHFSRFTDTMPFHTQPL